MSNKATLRKFSLVAAGSVLLTFGGVEAAQAASFTVFNSGVDNTGSVLPNGAIDPHYEIVDSVNGPSNTFAVAANPAYIPNSSTSEWIGPNTNAGLSNVSVGNFTYRTTFDLTGDDPNTAVLKGNFASDNNTVAVLLNGKNTGITSGYEDFGKFTPFSLASAFVNGVNTLDFVVYNGGGPSGLRTEFTQATANTLTQATTKPVPEPLTILGSVAALGFGGIFKRQHSKKLQGQKV